MPFLAIYGGSNSVYNDSRDWTQCFQATLVAVVAVVVVPVVSPVAPVAPCAGLGGFMTTDLRQFVLLMVQRSGVHQLRLVVYPFIPLKNDRFYTFQGPDSAGFLNHQQ